MTDEQNDLMRELMGCVRCLEKEVGTINVRYLPTATTTPAWSVIMEWINERHICILYKTRRIWAEICLSRRILLQCAKGWVPHNNTPTEKLLTIFSNSASNFPTYKKLVTSISTSCSMHFNFNAFISTCVECMWSWWKAFRNRNVALFTVINEF